MWDNDSSNLDSVSCCLILHSSWLVDWLEWRALEELDGVGMTPPPIPQTCLERCPLSTCENISSSVEFKLSSFALDSISF
jgi:hypothetical protein